MTCKSTLQEHQKRIKETCSQKRRNNDIYGQNFILLKMKQETHTPKH